MADVLLRRFLFFNLSYSRKCIILKALRGGFATEASSNVDLLSNVSFLTNDCTIEELEAVQDMVSGNLEVYENFVSEEEEDRLIKEVEPYLKTQKYQFDHWDGAIKGYRETEKSRWTDDCLRVFKRMRDTSFKPNTKLLSHVHVLDLDGNGYIKPHIDSVKFCGPTIAGLSLLSSSVMRLIHEKYSSVTVDLLLPRRSMYILRDSIRYEFTHEVLEDKTSRWKGEHIPRDRRISVILRCQP
ncbi:alpha-ketoglutarate-dependent dioxygenase alkB homolog 7, mitochondrial-like [Actinia tenebrosa]|uniref:Alpha-ketoglutarate-dependent dioxygenase alkB homolog 7, mitochondrial-like n=1 Tax=Actinia tenebrosa TaxID=6105 RepID=A0A6P8ICS4_ACTTE|nr:alpha-ketoglutarate-dependent dioxygenase alkB homolog 7, mitochondrial-like [Actinia tenebrosa]